MKRDGEALPRPTVVGLLAGGRWRACVTGYAMLWRRGRLEHDGRGRVDRRGAPPREADPIERSLFNALLGAQGAREAAGREKVQQALRDARRELGRLGLRRSLPRRVLIPLACLVVPAWLAARTGLPPLAGIVGVLAGTCAAVWFAWPRTIRGERLLSDLRRRHPLPPAPSEAGPEAPPAGSAPKVRPTTPPTSTAPDARSDAISPASTAPQVQPATTADARPREEPRTPLATTAPTAVPRARTGGAAARRRGSSASNARTGDAAAAEEVEALGMLVALHGNAALRALLPDVARGGGLYDGGRWSREFRNENPSGLGEWSDAAAHHLDADRP
ncbi:TIGR04222 domain-containing membrane protein [Dactylosporangium sp. AC04546]|uniref:TIGR04222 domain-containing membrane protein n=1 Tax=Dactylosporangium sp. AC04546 TaxID=2862460 RepID=UPI001EDF9AF9|nr:TIGR04222 domain-containing membrane protein [Dactylosporangium sp. AC04546]WVK78372.1 TIGR04222 domain-containing membrane protein [Dactylosporangium sp. AC04546]